jgi:hypothetical protein
MIAIGALGGSGTRAVAEVLIQAGLYLGNDLNEANDNLLFTRLFKDPIWYKQSSNYKIKRRLDIFSKYMQRDVISPIDFMEICRAANANPIVSSAGDFYTGMLKKVWKKPDTKHAWGWKEPNTQIYLDHLMDWASDLKYIHVTRHGLDMAFSKNKQQLYNWGWKFDIHINGQETEEELTIKQLDFWIRSNQFVTNIIRQDPSRCLVIHHDQFCKDPVMHIDNMLAFCGLNPSSQTRHRLYSIPQDTGSNNRFKTRDIRLFRKDQLEQVVALGCQI